jgi:tetratricopeptide (TPR) repeat protein
MIHFATRFLLGVSLIAFAYPAAAQEEDPSALEELDRQKAAQSAGAVEVQGAAELRGAMMRIARSPTDSDALIDAGNAALMLGDANAALNFFTRANSLQPSNGRIKLGLAIATVRSENPFEALRLFDEAIKLGIPERAVAADRALAFDLLGNFGRAQQDYNLAKQSDRSNRLIVQQAISVALLGKEGEADAMLFPLLKQNYGEAWRARAFLLAARGDYKESVKVTQGFMDARSAQQFERYLRQMPQLTGAQKAAAIHLGHFPANNIGRDSESVQRVASNYPSTGATGDGRLVPAGDPLGPKAGSQTKNAAKLSRRERERAAKRAAQEVQVPAAIARPVSEVADLGSRVPLPIDIARARIMEVEKASFSLVASALPVANLAAAPFTPPAPTSASTSIPVNVAIAAPSSVPQNIPGVMPPLQTPAPMAAPPVGPPPVSPSLTSFPPAALPSAAQNTTSLPTTTSSPTILPQTIPPPATQLITAPSPSTPMPSAPEPSFQVLAEPAKVAQSLPAATPPAITPPVSQEASPISVPPPPAQTVPIQSPPAVSPPVVSPSVQSAPVPVQIAPVQPAPETQPEKTQGATIEPFVPPPSDSVPTISNYQNDAVPSGSQPQTQAPIQTAPVTAQPQPQPQPAPAAAPVFDLGAVVNAIDIPDAEKKRDVVPVDLKKLPVTTPKPKDTAQADDKKSKATEKSTEQNSSPRIWVQVATGDAGGFSGDMRIFRRKYTELFKGKDSWSSPWGKQSRLLVGPFDDLKVAKKWEADFRKAGGNGFVWRSEKGTEVKALKSK